MSALKNGTSRKNCALYVRNFIFGVEDSLVSTVGLLSGVAIAGVPRSTILLTGIVLIFVEAFSMAVGSFLSEHSAEEFVNHKVVSIRSSLNGGVIMFFSYFVSGFIPLAPYILAIEVRYAMLLSIGASLAALFMLGALSARIFKINVMHKALEMLIIGGIAVIVGAVVGSFIG